MAFEEFGKNKMVVQSVLYNFVIIGEASVNIPDEIQTLDPTIPWRNMSDMRNLAMKRLIEFKNKARS
ncbi:DUF86 domain-containing protein [Pseudanabaena sp. UWO310]|nr:DUF86 domain-containing protein [Pseudanabaena sp. UWO310]